MLPSTHFFAGDTIFPPAPDHGAWAKAFLPVADESPQPAPAAPAAADLVLEYLEHAEPADPAPWLARLADDDERARFLELLEGARVARRSLPRLPAPDALLAGRYRIRERIAEGGQGGVFAADDLHLRRRVAIKVLAAHAQGDPAGEARLEKESRILAALRHPSIVAVHELARDGALTFLVMDLVPGRSLADVLDRARSLRAAGAELDGALLERAIGACAPAGRSGLVDPESWWRSVARVTGELARTIEAAHEAGVIHRDLKPANVMLQGGGLPVVLDFGLAGDRALEPGDLTHALHGSVPYLAPEQASSQSIGIDPRTDVYQLGLVLYELLTLRRAFPDQAIATLIEKVRTGDFRAPRAAVREVPSGLEAVCLRACELDPARRYPSARELAEDVDRWLAGSPTLAERAGWLRRSLRRAQLAARRHPWRTASALVLAAVTLAFLALPGAGPVHDSRFYRYDPDRRELVSLPQTGGRVRAGDWLGIHLDVSEPRFVYALSSFGEASGERRLAPWKPAMPEAPERSRAAEEPWGLAVSPGRHNVLCVQVGETNPAEIEGLIVLVSDVAQPEIEEWFARMDWAALEQGDGLEREGAVALLERVLTPSRGVRERDDAPEGSQPWTEAQKRALREDLAAGRAPSDGRLFGLPGVEEHTLECRVARR